MYILAFLINVYVDFSLKSKWRDNWLILARIIFTVAFCWWSSLSNTASRWRQITINSVLKGCAASVWADITLLHSYSPNAAERVWSLFFFYLCLKTEIIACWLLPLWISCKESYIHVFVILEILLTVTAEIRSVLDRFLLSVYNKDLSVPDAPVQTAEVSSLFQGPSRKLNILLILFEFWRPSNCFFCVFLLLCPQLTVFQCLFYPAGEALWSLQSAISSLLLLLLYHFK